LFASRLKEEYQPIELSGVKTGILLVDLFFLASYALNMVLEVTSLIANIKAYGIYAESMPR